jgi:uncharacterized Zn finger protein (UPF0148 family)
MNKCSDTIHEFFKDRFYYCPDCGFKFENENNEEKKEKLILPILELAYQVQEIYRTKKPVGEAILDIKDKNKSVDLDTLWAMWYAIDAYDFYNKTAQEYGEKLKKEKNIESAKKKWLAENISDFETQGTDSQ